MVASKFLTRWGLIVELAENGKIATEKVWQTHYDLVLMDLQMPEMDGYTATQVIRNFEGERFQKLPIIALTASAMQTIQRQVLEAGMNDFISKPFNPNDLNERISKYISRETPSAV